MRKSIKYQLALYITLLITFVIGMCSWFYYLEFRSALNERVLLQLTSIKRLKRLQIENYLQETLTHLNAKQKVSKGERFEILSLDSVAIRFPELRFKENTGIIDISHNNPETQLELLFYKKEKNAILLFFTKAPKIQSILLERTGMGQSGETYLVGQDKKLRSHSRFMNWEQARNVTVDTRGVNVAIQKSAGTGIYDDYRGIKVFGAYHHIDVAGLQLVILSEIDDSEALKPLTEIQITMIYIAIGCCVFALCLTYILADVLSRPLQRVKTSLDVIAQGKLIRKPVTRSFTSDEIGSMNRSLASLIDSIEAVTKFADEIGRMNLEAKFAIRSDNDQLGRALQRMQQKLIEFRKNEAELNKQQKRTLIQGQEKERHRLSRDLHDDIGPLLTSLRLFLSSQNMDNKEEAKERIDFIIQEVRRLTRDLMPSALIDFGIKTALENYFKGLQENVKILIYFSFDNDDNIRVPDEINIALYRITLEAVNNAVKHSNAGEIIVNITVFEEFVSLYIKDNGDNGIELKAGNGIINMRERVQALDGTFQIELTTKGVIIEAEIPLS